VRVLEVVVRTNDTDKKPAILSKSLDQFRAIHHV